MCRWFNSALGHHAFPSITTMPVARRRAAKNGFAVSMLLVAALWLPCRALSMEMELVDDALILHGASITLDDWVSYRELTQGKRFSKVVLLNQAAAGSRPLWASPKIPEKFAVKEISRRELRRFRAHLECLRHREALS